MKMAEVHVYIIIGSSIYWLVPCYLN
jgi:hypothetical protein